MNAPNVTFERERAAACLAQAQVHVERMRAAMKPGISDSVASMLGSDIESAHDRVQWLRDRAETEGDSGGRISPQGGDAVA